VNISNSGFHINPYFRLMDSPTKVQAWLYAFRLRTLPLSFSSIITGSFIAYRTCFSWLVFALALVTTLLLQVLSNIANDYGDSEKGTDNDDRIGPKRAIQAGILSFAEMRTAIIIFSVLCLISGCSLIFVSLQEQALIALLFLALGIGAIAAALKYTIGKSAYGYNGMGDIFVLLFFGLVGVGGSYYLQAHTFDWTILLPGLAIGCFATGVLNLNNMRDRLSPQCTHLSYDTDISGMGCDHCLCHHTLCFIDGVSVPAICTPLLEKYLRSMAGRRSQRLRSLP
jgi:1,4-dihydroxy-2-naphthoate octaprenyltransferase